MATTVTMPTKGSFTKEECDEWLLQPITRNFDMLPGFLRGIDYAEIRRGNIMFRRHYKNGTRRCLPHLAYFNIVVEKTEQRGWFRHRLVTVEREVNISH